MELKDSLRGMAAELRKVAGLLSKPSRPIQKVAQRTVELDPGKVRDFLVFAGSANRMWRRRDA